MTEAPLIEFERVFVMRGKTVALKDVSLRVGVGDHVAILGPNGCGKSTLIKTITRDCYPLLRDGSSLRILGQDRWNIFELRPLLGIVSSELMNTCTRAISGRDVVLTGFFSSMVLLPEDEVTPEMRQRADRALARLDALHLAEKSTDEMSSGEARRVLLARALAHEPRALLLDEPFTALDLSAQHELKVILRRLARSGMGIIMVTHHVPDIIPEVDRVVLMDRGSIRADGPKPDVLTATGLSELFGHPLELVERDGYYNLW